MNKRNTLYIYILIAIAIFFLGLSFKHYAGGIFQYRKSDLDKAFKQKISVRKNILNIETLESNTLNVDALSKKLTTELVNSENDITVEHGERLQQMRPDSALLIIMSDIYNYSLNHTLKHQKNERKVFVFWNDLREDSLVLRFKSIDGENYLLYDIEGYSKLIIDMME